MKPLNLSVLTCTTALVFSSSSYAELLVFYANGTDEDAAALLNVAPSVANIVVSDLSDMGAQTGDPVRITRPSFSTDSPAGPTAGSMMGSEWLEARSTENQGVPPTTDDNYFVFTVTADPGFAVDLESLKYDFWVSPAIAENAVAMVEGFVSVDGGEFVSFGSITASDTDGDIAVAAPVATANLDLSSITGAASVEVRIAVGYSEGNSFGISGFAQGIQLDGAVVVQEPDSFPLAITPNASTPGTYDLTWESQDNLLYDLVSSTDLSTAIDTWEVWMGNSDIPGTAPENTLEGVSGDGAAKRFFAMIEKVPPPLLSADFEDNDGGFVVSVVDGVSEGTSWEWGVADSDNQNGVAVTGACWAVGLGTWDGGNGAPGYYDITSPGGTSTTNLRSAAIDLTGLTNVELSFREAIDAETGDVAVVYVVDGSGNVIDDDGDAGTDTPIYDATDGLFVSSAWRDANGGVAIPLPAAAMGQTVQIEWRFSGSADEFLGWYIDDVLVDQVAPAE